MAGRPARVAPVLLALALMTAALLRLIDLGGPSLWDDELSTVRFCEQPAGAIVGLSVFLDVNPPLFYLLQHAWQALVPPGEYGWRLLAALLGLLNVALIYLYGRELAGERPALLAAWIAAISPQHVYSSQEVRSQTALLALLLAAAWCLGRIERDGRARWGAAAGLATAAALWTHYYALFFAATWFGYALWRTLGRAWDRPRRRAALAWVFSAGLLFAPGALILLIQLQGGQGWRPERRYNRELDSHGNNDF